MEIVGRKYGEVWALDEQLGEVARELVVEFMRDLGHIDLKRVIFVRQTGLKGSAADWYGKCYYIKEPYNMVTLYMLSRVIDVDSIRSTMSDICYIIALNNDSIYGIPNREKVERAVLHHELKHINLDMNGIEKHNVKDFKFMLKHYGVEWSSGNFDTGEK